MAIRNESEIVAFDADAAAATVRDRLGESVLVCAEYDTEEFRVLYASDEAIDRYGSREDLEDVADGIHAYLHVDFTEKRLFEELYPPAEETRAFVTYTDYATIARVLAGDEGLYVSLTPDADVTAVVDAVEDAI